MPEESVPMWIDSYQVESFLGAGSFADTYSVNSRDGRFVLKWLRANAQVGGDLRFQNEAWTLEQLQHDAIPHYIASGTAMGRPYIVMTLVPGRSLRKRLSIPVSDRGTFGEIGFYGPLKLYWMRSAISKNTGLLIATSKTIM